METQEQKVAQKYEETGFYLVNLQITNESKNLTLNKTQKIVVKKKEANSNEFKTDVPLVAFDYMLN